MFSRLRDWWHTAPTQLPFEEGQVTRPSEYTITDGVDYSQPPVVPYFVPRDTASVQRYLEHTWATPGSTAQADPRETYRFQFDGNRSATYDGRIDMPIDDPLCEWDYGTRKDVLTNCHAAYHRNPLAKAAVDLTRRYVVGKGHTVTAHNKDVQAVIDEFRANKENNVFGYDRTFIQDLQVDGELFIRYFSERGQMVIAQIPPWYVRKANTARGFLRRIISWQLEYATEDGLPEAEEVPGDMMLHVAINNHGYELRGRPDLFVILPWLRAYNEWITDRARQNKWRNALLWVVQVASKIPGAVNKVRAAWRTPPTPGSVAVVPDSVTVNTLNNPVGAGDAAEDGRQIKLQAIVGVGLPEYMMSDGENANLASATAQQLPALWKFIDAQEMMVEQVWTPIYKHVIQAAVDEGIIPEMVEVQDPDGDPVMVEGTAVDPVKAVDAFQVTYYELQADDPKTLAEAVTMLVTNRISSTETARERVGLNHHIEEKRLAAEESASRDRATMGNDTDLSGDPMVDPEDEAAEQDAEQGQEAAQQERGSNA